MEEKLGALAIDGNLAPLVADEQIPLLDRHHESVQLTAFVQTCQMLHQRGGAPEADLDVATARLNGSLS